MAHTIDFWKEKYRELEDYAFDKNVDFPYTSLDDFINDYNFTKLSGSKNVMKDLKYDLQYETRYNTAIAVKRALEASGIKVSLKDVKLTRTPDIAADPNVNPLIKADYANFKAAGMTGKEAALAISRYWFGSK